MRVKLTEDGLVHYQRSADKRARERGTVLYELPSGSMVIDWDKSGVMINYPNEVEVTT